MNSGMKVGAFFKEFSFLESFINKKEVEKIRVSRVDQELLSRREKTEGDLLTGRIEERFILLDELGFFITTVGRVRCKSWWWIFGQKSKNIEEELLFLKERGESRDVFYVLSVFGDEVIIYKSPKGYNVSTWIEELIKRERAMIKSDVKEIDIVS